MHRDMALERYRLLFLNQQRQIKLLTLQREILRKQLQILKMPRVDTNPDLIREFTKDGVDGNLVKAEMYAADLPMEEREDEQ